MKKSVFFGNESDEDVYVKLYSFIIIEDDHSITLTCNFYISLGKLLNSSLIHPGDVYALEIDENVKLGYNIMETAPGFAIKKHNALDGSGNIFLILVKVSASTTKDSSDKDTNLTN